MPQDSSSKIAQQQQQKISGNLKMSKLSTTVSQPGGQGGTSSCSASGASSCHHHYHHHYPPKHRRTGSGKVKSTLRSRLSWNFWKSIFEGFWTLRKLVNYTLRKNWLFWGLELLNRGFSEIDKCLINLRFAKINCYKRWLIIIHSLITGFPLVSDKFWRHIRSLIQ